MTIISSCLSRQFHESAPPGIPGSQIWNEGRIWNEVPCGLSHTCHPRISRWPTDPRSAGGRHELVARVRSTSQAIDDAPRDSCFANANGSGKLVDIGDGQRLYLDCRGKGSPAVILEAGAGDLSLVWAFVQEKVARFTTVCSYDRAGYLWSDPGARPRTYAQLALELHAALARAAVRTRSKRGSGRKVSLSIE